MSSSDSDADQQPSEEEIEESSESDTEEEDADANKYKVSKRKREETSDEDESEGKSQKNKVKKIKRVRRKRNVKKEEEPKDNKKSFVYKAYIIELIKESSYFMKKFDSETMAILKDTPFWKFFEAIHTKKLVEDRVRRAGNNVQDLIQLYSRKMGGFLLSKNTVPLKLSTKLISLLFGIPIKGTIFDPTDNTPHMDGEFKKRYFKDTRQITKREIKDQILKLQAKKKITEDGKKDMVKLLILYSFSTFFFCSSSGIISKAMLRKFDDIEEVKSISWPRVIYRALRDKLNKNAATNPQAVAGCVHIIIYTLLEHSNLVDDIKDEEMRSPRILKWNLEMVTGDKWKSLKKKLVDIKINENFEDAADNEKWLLEDNADVPADDEEDCIEITDDEKNKNDDEGMMKVDTEKVSSHGIKAAMKFVQGVKQEPQKGKGKKMDPREMSNNEIWEHIDDDELMAQVFELDPYLDELPNDKLRLKDLVRKEREIIEKMSWELAIAKKENKQSGVDMSNLDAMDINQMKYLLSLYKQAHWTYEEKHKRIESRTVAALFDERDADQQKIEKLNGEILRLKKVYGDREKKAEMLNKLLQECRQKEFKLIQDIEKKENEIAELKKDKGENLKEMMEDLVEELEVIKKENKVLKEEAKAERKDLERKLLTAQKENAKLKNQVQKMELAQRKEETTVLQVEPLRSVFPEQITTPRKSTRTKVSPKKNDDGKGEKFFVRKNSDAEVSNEKDLLHTEGVSTEQSIDPKNTKKKKRLHLKSKSIPIEDKDSTKGVVQNVEDAQVGTSDFQTPPKKKKSESDNDKSVGSVEKHAEDKDSTKGVVENVEDAQVGTSDFQTPPKKKISESDNDKSVGSVEKPAEDLVKDDQHNTEPGKLSEKGNTEKSGTSSDERKEKEAVQVLQSLGKEHQEEKKDKELNLMDDPTKSKHFEFFDDVVQQRLLFLANTPGKDRVIWESGAYENCDYVTVNAASLRKLYKGEVIPPKVIDWYMKWEMVNDFVSDSQTVTCMSISANLYSEWLAVDKRVFVMQEIKEQLNALFNKDTKFIFVPIQEDESLWTLLTFEVKYMNWKHYKCMEVSYEERQQELKPINNFRRGIEKSLRPLLKKFQNKNNIMFHPIVQPFEEPILQGDMADSGLYICLLAWKTVVGMKTEWKEEEVDRFKRQWIEDILTQGPSTVSWPPKKLRDVKD